jgi:integrase
MKRQPEKALTAAGVRNAKPGRHCDGNGLYLYVEPSGSRRWVLRTFVHGKRRSIGLGSARLVSLQDAREEATRLRGIARKKGDPLAVLRSDNIVIPSFAEAARKVHETHAASFKARHADRWMKTLKTYVFPVIGTRQMNDIQSSDVMKVLTPIWSDKPETARRVKQRMHTVFAYGKAHGWLNGDNPVDTITKVLPRQRAKAEHHAALPYAQVPTFIEVLRDAEQVNVIIRMAFEFLILTATRTSEVLNATWREIDLDGATWTIPAKRMKAQVEHRVPLSPRCIEILQAAQKWSFGDEYVFPGRTAGKSLSNMVFLMALRRMNQTGITAHGFRSSFRDWAEERTTTQRSVVEAALAHTVESKVEAAYLRSDLFDKRRHLMDTWAAFVTVKPSEKVVRMR